MSHAAAEHRLHLLSNQITAAEHRLSQLVCMHQVRERSLPAVRRTSSRSGERSVPFLTASPVRQSGPRAKLNFSHGFQYSAQRLHVDSHTLSSPAATLSSGLALYMTAAFASVPVEPTRFSVLCVR
eukprot:4708702-Pleurochrysis_carterae.AAC.3